MRKRAHGLHALRGSKFRGGEFDPAQFCPQAFASRVRAGRKQAKASSAGTRPGRPSCRSLRLSGFLPPGLCPHTLASRVGGGIPPPRNQLASTARMPSEQGEKKNTDWRLHVSVLAGTAAGRATLNHLPRPKRRQRVLAEHTAQENIIPGPTKHFLIFEAGLHTASARRRFAQLFQRVKQCRGRRVRRQSKNLPLHLQFHFLILQTAGARSHLLASTPFSHFPSVLQTASARNQEQSC